MKYSYDLERVVVIKRYKRFFADVQRENGEILTVHVPNTGPMLGAYKEGVIGYIMRKENPKKMSHGLELLETEGGELLGVNTQIPNRLVRSALESQELFFCDQYSNIKPEAKIGESKIDFLLSQEGLADCYLEVKNCSGKVEDTAFFPDTKSERALKHLRELVDLKSKGFRSILLFVVQRSDCSYFSPGDSYHPEYGIEIRSAFASGVEIFAISAKISLTGICLDKFLELKL